ncbi:MAG: SDR family NAD(P)-dependent oxidoreductase, partial [Actinobacteria bacterium]|nr:SDR family NAD(P)-dependent oxidoreductase [Actinomycetota bacterium]
MTELSGRVALVTGANQGIGAATAIALARLGADVAITYLRLTEDTSAGRPVAYGEQRGRDGSDAVAAIEAQGRRGFAIEADLADPDAPTRLFDAVEAELGAVDVLVNNASGWRKDTFGYDAADWIGRDNSVVTADTVDAQYLVDARGGALMISAFAQRHRSRRATWGRIVSLTSGGPMGFPGEASYGAAKAALENYTMTASIELAASGITANVVYPPVTDTGWVTDE